jgi:hypothetical protein
MMGFVSLYLSYADLVHAHSEVGCAVRAICLVRGTRTLRLLKEGRDKMPCVEYTLSSCRLDRVHSTFR